MRNEIAKVPVAKAPAMRRKTGSIESIRDLDMILDEKSTSSPVQASPIALRKRKPTSVLSGHGSGPLKYRSRTMIIVHYDGQIQKSFEIMVRNIGTGRNMLRKGKMAAKMEAFAELAGSDDSGDSDEDTAPKMGYRPRPGFTAMRSRPGMQSGRGANNSSELFDSTDKALESAQGLCEKGAHQSLRDGDCRKELELVRKHFESVLEAASKEVAKYGARPEESSTLPSQLDPSTRTPSRIQAKPLLPDVRPDVAVATTTAKAVAIEVDEDSDDNDDFVMPPIRLTSRV